jgi:hypothetical protein
MLSLTWAVWLARPVVGRVRKLRARSHARFTYAFAAFPWIRYSIIDPGPHIASRGCNSQDLAARFSISLSLSLCIIDQFGLRLAGWAPNLSPLQHIFLQRGGGVYRMHLQKLAAFIRSDVANVWMISFTDSAVSLQQHPIRLNNSQGPGTRPPSLPLLARGSRHGSHCFSSDLLRDGFGWNLTLG